MKYLVGFLIFMVVYWAGFWRGSCLPQKVWVAGGIDDKGTELIGVFSDELDALNQIRHLESHQYWMHMEIK